MPDPLDLNALTFELRSVMSLPRAERGARLDLFANAASTIEALRDRIRELEAHMRTCNGFPATVNEQPNAMSDADEEC